MRIFLNPLLLPDTASVHTYPMYPANESATFWMRYESGIVRTLNQDNVSSGDVTRSSPVLYRKYCIQDGNLVPRFSLLPVDGRVSRARLKFRALYNACSVANIPRGVLGTKVNPDTPLIRVDGQIWFEYGYLWSLKYWIRKGKVADSKYPDSYGRGLKGLGPVSRKSR